MADKLLTQDLKLAYKLGKDAFKSGKKAVPAQDQDLAKLIHKHNGPVVKNSPVMQLLTMWTTGWHRANLDAPIKENKSIKLLSFMPKNIKETVPQNINTHRKPGDVWKVGGKKPNEYGNYGACGPDGEILYFSDLKWAKLYARTGIHSGS